MTTTVEFAVQMTCESCVNKIENCLKDIDGIKNVQVSKENGTVLVESVLPSNVIKEKIESTGRKAVLKGYGAEAVLSDSLVCKSAVAMLGGTQGYSINPGIKGVIRFVQTDKSCVVDGTIDGLTPGLHGLYIYQCGDLTEGCQSIGDHFDYDLTEGKNYNKKHTGDLGNVEAGKDGRAVFRFQSNGVKVWDIIGRSVGVTEESDTCQIDAHSCGDTIRNPALRLACGIISRSAGLFENAKRICACDGVNIWDERDRPLAGPGRQSQSRL